MKDNNMQDINDADDNSVILDEDDEYIVEYRKGDYVAEEYDSEDVAMTIEEEMPHSKEYTEDDQNYYEDIDIDDDRDQLYETSFSDSEEYAEDTESYYEDIEEYSDDEDEYYESEEYSYDEDEFDTAYEDINTQYWDKEAYDINGNQEDDDDDTKGFVAWFKKTVKSITVFDAVLGITGVIVTAAIIIIVSLLLQSENTDKQVEAIAPVGEELSEIGIVGSEGLLAMSSSAYSGAFTNLIDEEEEISTVDVSDEATSTKVNVNFSSVEKDLKIRFTDADTGALITGTKFEVTLTNSKGSKTVLTDDDMDGIIYVESIAAGTYDAVITSTDKYKFPTTSQQVTVKDKVQYVVINNIQDEVKTEKEVNVAAEDTAKNDAVQEEVVLQDTVEYVEESKTEVEGSENYLLIDKSTIADPSKVSLLASRMLFDTISVTLDKASLTLTVGESGTLSTNKTFSDNTDGDKKYTYTVEWSSDNKDVATVSDGSVTAVAAGTTTITCTVTETITEPGETTKNVKESLSEDDYNNLESDELKGKYTETTVDDKKVYVIYEEVVGESKTTTNSGSATCSVTVNAKAVTLNAITLELQKSADSCAVGSTLTVSPSKVTYSYSDGTSKTMDSGYSIAWSSADTSIATVDSSGVIKGVKAGTTTITGTITEGNVSKSANIGIEITEAKDLTLVLDKTSGVSIAVGANTTLVATVTNYKSDSGVTWTTSDKNVATVDEKGVVTAVSVGSVTITATTNEKNNADKNLTATCTVTVTSNAANDKITKLKDKNGNQIYVKNSDGTYREAVYADYYTETEFYIQASAQYAYTGWQTIDGKTYYYDKNGVPVTGTQIINGVTYNFGSDGAIASSVNGKTFGIDVSRHNGTIDWNAVKASGVDFVIIRCGYRGSSTGALIEDQNFKTNIKGATAAGLKVGVYVFSQAINEVEAVKEASLAVSLVKGYNLTYPIFIDTESSGGRGDAIDKATRTSVVNAFCQTVIAGGYKAGIYASKTWFESNLNMSSVGNYRIWLAQYAATPTYKSKYDMWQYSSKGKISGINGNVDLNYSYLGY
jgi:GH25 family lysozyme M1 (1,4-beta-N-acetylmuramidase)/uncharacterized protein YjdB